VSTPSRPAPAPSASRTRARRVVALLPAAGWATRLAGLEGSKEVLSAPGAEGADRRPVALALLEALARGGVERALVLLRHGKWDVAARLGCGGGALPRLGYVTTAGTGSVAESLDLAYPFVRGAESLLGFPDCLFEPGDAVARLLAHRGIGPGGGRPGSRAAVTLVLFPSDRPDKTDMVDVAEDGQVRGFEVRPGAGTRLSWTWLFAAWGGELTELLHARMSHDSSRLRGEAAITSMSQVFAAALAAGLEIDSVRLPEGSFLDIGTPEDLERARRWPQLNNRSRRLGD
jgi:glucose-1-phosphate thymidylyltransferase